jgi:hypothetical protein
VKADIGLHFGLARDIGQGLGESPVLFRRVFEARRAVETALLRIDGQDQEALRRLQHRHQRPQVEAVAHVHKAVRIKSQPFDAGESRREKYRQTFHGVAPRPLIACQVGKGREHLLLVPVAGHRLRLPDKPLQMTAQLVGVARDAAHRHVDRNRRCGGPFEKIPNVDHLVFLVPVAFRCGGAGPWARRPAGLTLRYWRGGSSATGPRPNGPQPRPCG